VDTHYCSEKCRKLGTARQAHLLKITSKVAKVAVKRKSTSSNSSAAAPVELGSNVVESTLESNDRSTDTTEPNENKV